MRTGARLVARLVRYPGLARLDIQAALRRQVRDVALAINAPLLILWFTAALCH